MTLPPGATIGILGAGQLGRMLAGAAIRLGFRVHILAPEDAAPARATCHAYTRADYGDAGALSAFAAACDVVTVEFENVPVAAVEAIAAAGVPVRPNGRALAVAQDRAEEKRFLEAAGLVCAPWRPVDSLADLEAAAAAIGPKAILKTRRQGYDGKGQRRLDAGSDLAGAWQGLSGAPAILEAHVAFEMEISVLIARDGEGARITDTPPQTHHAMGILRRSRVPAPLPGAVVEEAKALAGQLADQLDYIGVLALEFFVVSGRRLIANEFAPRVHNSGHWSVEACETCQFENHIRAVAGWPLGDPALRFPAEMENLIGEDAEAPVADLLSRGRLTLYGKQAARPGRKMGHLVRRLAP
ncbi:MAG: 5-(carboxyamino)imidazole ribonucleotide synthase [Pseudomonadota bacterium]